MTIRLLLGVALAGLGAFTSGCAFNRPNVTALSQEQVAYYKSLHKFLTDNRPRLELGLREQMKADAMRRANLLAWERDLQKAEVLLGSEQGVQGSQRLLSMKLAELDLATARVSTGGIDAARNEAILALWDRIAKGAEALERNGETLTQYLGSSDRAFALRTLDINGLVAAAAAVRSAQEELGQIEARSDEQRAKEAERVRRALERTRDVLLKSVSK